MWPLLYEGPPAIATYGLLVLVGFATGTLLVASRAPRVGIAVERLIPLMVVVPLAGLVGARLFEAFTTSLHETLADPSSLFGGGLTYYGGAIGAALAALVVMRVQRLPWAKMADILVPAVLIGNGIGRLGCLAAGCCHGAPVELSDHATPLLSGPAPQLWLDSAPPFLGVAFGPESVARFAGEVLYPTQLWSAFGLIGLGLLLVALWRARRFDGMVAGLGLVVEPVLRFGIEAFRGDARGRLLELDVGSTAALPPGPAYAETTVTQGVFGLTTSQGVGLAILLVGLVVLIRQRNAGVAVEVPVETSEV